MCSEQVPVIHKAKRSLSTAHQLCQTQDIARSFCKTHLFKRVHKFDAVQKGETSFMLEIQKLVVITKIHTLQQYNGTQRTSARHVESHSLRHHLLEARVSSAASCGGQACHKSQRRLWMLFPTKLQNTLAGNEQTWQFHWGSSSSVLWLPIHYWQHRVSLLPACSGCP